jgi:hypothetical protein
MPGLVPGIYVLDAGTSVDGRDKPGHDDGKACGPSGMTLGRLAYTPLAI